MTKHASRLTSLLSFGGAALLALLAIFLWKGSPFLAPASVAFLGALGLGYVGFRAHGDYLDAEALIQNRQFQADHLQAALEQQTQAVDALSDGLDIAVLICDGKASIQFANRRAVELFKFDDPIGRQILAVTLSYELEQLVVETARTHLPHNAELTFTYPEEQVGIAQAWPADGTGQRVFLTVYDITNLRRLERVRKDFVSNVSHELRTPLTLIRAMAETLLDEEAPDPELSSRYLNKIIGEVDRLSTISNDLLILSASESNPVRKHACDIAEVFRSVVEQLRKKATAKGLDLAFDGPDVCMVSANTAQMTQVAINLVDNAINYTTTGSVLVEVQCGEDSAAVRVIDTGIGIASEHLPRIFERFYRVDRARSRSSGGTGLGLSIVKHIVEAHGGSVRVDSSLNKGSTFTITLPAGDVRYGVTEEE